MSDEPTMKPPFRTWQRRADPFLAAADTNALYQAFRLRRHYPRSGWARVTRLFRWMDSSRGESNADIVMAAFLGGILAVMSLGVMLVPVLLAFKSMRHRRRFTGNRLPNTVGAAISGYGVHEAAAVDLWMTGPSGRDILEAHYLELVERVHYINMGVFVVVGLGVAGLWSTMDSPFTLLTAAAAGALLLLAWVLMRYQTVYGMRAIAAQLEDLARFWASDSFISTFIASVAERARHVLLSFALNVLTFFVPLCAVALGLLRLYPEAALAALGESPLETVLLVVAIYSTVWSMVAYSLLRQRRIARLARALDCADAAYQRFMAAEVMRDPDAEQWVRSNYNWMRASDEAATCENRAE